MIPNIPNLYGLRISAQPSSSGEGFLTWDQEVVEILPDFVGPSHFVEERDGQLWACHIYANSAGVACEFRISPDGQKVCSRSIPAVPQSDLLTLFAEPVMRSVFRARGLTSFHGAALARDNRAIVLLGEKGAGKSTAAAMLMCSGWSLLSDDLVLLKAAGDRWTVPTGFPHLKISQCTAEALGFDPAHLHRRWIMPGAPDDPSINKFVLEAEPFVLEGVPLQAIFILGERSAEDAEVRICVMSGIDRLRALLSNLSSDPCVDAPASLAQLRDINGLLQTTEVKKISFPNRISRNQVSLF